MFNKNNDIITSVCQFNMMSHKNVYYLTNVLVQTDCINVQCAFIHLTIIYIITRTRNKETVLCPVPFNYALRLAKYYQLRKEALIRR